MSANLLSLFEVAEPERQSRLRELRMAALLLLGPEHTVTQAIGAAIADPAALDTVLVELDALEALPRRRLLATLAAVLPGPRR